LVLWKPYYLFKDGLKESLMRYWMGVVRYISIFIITFCIGYFVKGILPMNPFVGWIEFLLYGIVLMGVYVICNIPLLYYWAPGVKDLVHRFIKKGT
jgi:hypothetical protein